MIYKTDDCAICGRPATMTIIRCAPHRHLCNEHGEKERDQLRFYDFDVVYAQRNEATDVFVSYSSEDKLIVDELLNALPSEAEALAFGSKAGYPPYKVFRDSESINSGDLWEQAIIEAIFKTRVLMPILSPGYLASPTCIFELLLFLNRTFVAQIVTSADGTGSKKRYLEGERRVTPYRIRDCEIPAAISRLHAPLIPESRPIPYEFMEGVRSSLKNGVSAALALRLMGAGGAWGDVGPDRDRQGIRNPERAARSVLELCKWFSEDLSSETTLSSIEYVADRTRAFLQS